MTNRELLRTPSNLLSKLDQQRRYVVAVDGTPMPCPACKKPVNLFDAAGIDIDAYDYGVTDYPFHCPGCGAKLEQFVPFVAGGSPLWRWQLDDAWLQERLGKAKAFDQQGNASTSASA